MGPSIPGRSEGDGIALKEVSNTMAAEREWVVSMLLGDNAAADIPREVVDYSFVQRSPTVNVHVSPQVFCLAPPTSDYHTFPLNTVLHALYLIDDPKDFVLKLPVVGEDGVVEEVRTYDHSPVQAQRLIATLRTGCDLEKFYDPTNEKIRKGFQEELEISRNLNQGGDVAQAMARKLATDLLYGEFLVSEERTSRLLEFVTEFQSTEIEDSKVIFYKDSPEVYDAELLREIILLEGLQCTSYHVDMPYPIFDDDGEVVDVKRIRFAKGQYDKVYAVLFSEGSKELEND